MVSSCVEDRRACREPFLVARNICQLFLDFGPLSQLAGGVAVVHRLGCHPTQIEFDFADGIRLGT